MLIADIEAAEVITNAYFQTSKSWVGQVTITLQNNGTGDATTFALTFNRGTVWYESANDSSFNVTELSFTGRAAQNDSGFDVVLYKHSSSGWVYSAGAFTPGGEIIAKFTDTNVTEVDLVANNYFNYKLNSLNTSVAGDNGEGYILMITTGINNSIDYINTKIGIS